MPPGVGKQITSFPERVGLLKPFSVLLLRRLIARVNIQHLALDPLQQICNVEITRNAAVLV